MTGNDYQYHARLTANPDMHEDLERGVSTCSCLGKMLNASLGLSGEVGELNDLIKKWIFHHEDLDIIHAKKEIGDILWYIVLMCDAFGFTLDEVMQTNVDKLKARYENKGFDYDHAQHKKEGDV